MFRKKLEKLPTTDLEVQIIDWASYDITETNFDDSDDDSDDDDYVDLNNQNTYKKKKVAEKKYMIRMYGLNKDGQSVCVHVNSFTPYFFVKIPQTWDQSNVDYLMLEVNKKIDMKVGRGSYYAKKALIKKDIVLRKEFYGFTNNKEFKFLRLIFKNFNAYNKYKEVFNDAIRVDNKLMKFQLYETNISPMLRFMHCRDIIPAAWIKIERGKYDYKHITRCQIEVSVEWKDVLFLDKNDIGPIQIASFDIECTSSDGSFPTANRKNDKVIQIGTTVHKNGEKECFLHHIVTLKRPEKISKEEVDAKNLIVEYYDNERDVILAWAKFINALDPDIITGYNIWGFDMIYLYERAKNGNGGDVFDYSDLFMETLARCKDDVRIYSRDEEREVLRASKFTIKKLASSALGDNLLKYFEIEGIVGIDLMKVVQRDHKLESYKLDFVAETFLKLNKIDLPPKKIFENFVDGSPEKIKEIAVYCLKDCVLVNHLIMKLNILPNNIGMANVCCVPLSYLFLRGQGIKIYSLVAKECRKEGYLIKVVKADPNDKSSYEGAIVFTPKPGIYFEPVAVNDYASLYPSSMIAENLSHDSLVWVKIYDQEDRLIKVMNGYGTVIEEYKDGKLIKKKGELQYVGLEDYNYNEIKYDNFEKYNEDLHKNIPKKYIISAKPDNKVLTGYTICCFAEHKDGSKSLLPRILQKLLKARKDTRKRIIYKTLKLNDGKEYSGIYDEKKGEIICEKEGVVKIDKNSITNVSDTYGEFMKAVWDGLQLSYKVSCNSMYGQCGARSSSVSNKFIAASTTAVGRGMVVLAKDETLKKFPGSKLVYGDSILGDTPLLLKDKDGNMIITSINKLLIDKWEQYKEFKDKSFNNEFKNILDNIIPSSVDVKKRKEYELDDYTIESKWMGGKPYGCISKTGYHYTITFNIKEIDYKKAKWFNIKKYDSEEDAYNDALNYQWKTSKKLGYIKNQYRYIKDNKTNMKFIEVKLTQNISMFCDVKDLDLVENNFWYAREDSHNAYATTNIYTTANKEKKINKSFHFMVIEKMLKKLPKCVRYNIMNGKTIDHININSLDNRRINLRLSTMTDQKFNQKIYKNNKYESKGILFLDYNKGKKWMAYWKDYNKKKYTKYFDTKEEAIDYRNKKVEEVNKEYDEVLEEYKEKLINEILLDQSNRKEKEQTTLDYKIWTSEGWSNINRLIRHKTSKKIYRIVSNHGISDVTEDHSLLDQNKHLIRPNDCKLNKTILLSSYPYYEINKKEKDEKIFIEFDDQLDCAKKYLELKKNGYNINLDFVDNKYIIKSAIESKNFVKNIIELDNDYQDYVYDFETEVGNYLAGTGSNIHLNTDSVFINYIPFIKQTHHNEELTEYRKMELTAKYSQEAADHITEISKNPQWLQFEKILYPFIIFSKKRYVSNKYEGSITKHTRNSMGIVLKRRDNAPIVKDIYGGIIDTILNERNIEKAKQYFKDKVNDLLAGNVDIKRLVITKSIRGNYANPTSIAHKVLADRMGERDPGNKPMSNDRIPYCYIDTSNLKCFKCGAGKLNEMNCKCITCMKMFCSKHLHNHKDICVKMCRFCKMVSKTQIKQCKTCKGWYCDDDMYKHRLRTDKYKVEHHDKCKKPLTNKILQGDILEHPSYIRENSLKIDYKYYLDHQIEKPCMQIFSLTMKNPYSLIAAAVRKYNNKKSGNQEITEWFSLMNVKTSEDKKDETNDDKIYDNFDDVFEDIIDNEYDIVDDDDVKII